MSNEPNKIIGKCMPSYITEQLSNNSKIRSQKPLCELLEMHGDNYKSPCAICGLDWAGLTI